MKSDLSKRNFLAIAVQVPLFLSAVYTSTGLRLAHAMATGVPVLTEHQLATLTRISYLLFPYPMLGIEPYQRAAAIMSDTLVNQADHFSLVVQGISMLDSMGTQPWLDLPENGQLDLLRKIESEAFFQWVLQATKNSLFTRSEVWALIGYEGSSMEFGGYLNHGLNDIDWLD
ncbi:MAG: hypothetical protein V3S21_05475 [Xanthomonadales bacterium]